MDRHWHRSAHGFPRTARLNTLLQEVIAEEVRRLEDLDDRLGLITVTGVECDPDLRRATVLLAHLDDEVAAALEEHRRALQSELGTQLHLRRTPALQFVADPAIEAGERVEAALRRVVARQRDQER